MRTWYLRGLEPWLSTLHWRLWASRGYRTDEAMTLLGRAA